MGNCSCLNLTDRDEQQTSDFSGLESVVDLDAETVSDFNKGSVDSLSVISFESTWSKVEVDNVYCDDDCCCICSFKYDDDKHLPRILPCGHIICKDCIRQLARQNKFMNLKCPMDRQRHVIKQRSTGRLPNVTLYDQSGTHSHGDESGALHRRLYLPSDYDDDDGDNEDDEDEQFLIDVAISPGSLTSLDTELSIFDTPRGLRRNLDESEIDLSYFERDFGGNYSPHHIDAEMVALEDRLDGFEDMASPNATTLRPKYQYVVDTPNGIRQNNNSGLKRTVVCDRKHTDFWIAENARDVYDDERSERSFEWMEPDYSSGSESVPEFT